MCEIVSIGSQRTVSERLPGIWSAGKAFWVQASRAGFSVNLWMLGAGAQDLLRQAHGKHSGRTEQKSSSTIYWVDCNLWLFGFRNEKEDLRAGRKEEFHFVICLLSIVAIHVKKNHDIKGICGKRTGIEASLGLQGPERPETKLGELEQQLLK